MKKWICIAAVLVLFTPPSTARSQGNASPLNQEPRLTLTRAIEMALDHNERIAASRHRVEGADQRIGVARSGFFPQVNVGEAFRRTTNPMWAFGTKLNQEVIAQSDFDPARLNDPPAIDNFSTVFSAHWPVFDAGRTWYGWRQAKLDHQAAVQGAARLQQEIIAMTVEAYAGVILANQYLQTIDQALASARSHLDMIASRLNAGLVVKSDLLRAQVHIARLTQQGLDARSRAIVAMAGLNAVMGRPVDAANDLPPILDPGAPATEDVSRWSARALEVRPDLQAIRLKEQMAEEEVRKTRAAHFPSVSVVSDYEINTEDFSGSGDNYTVGAMVSLNLFSGQGFSARQREAAAALAEARALARGMVRQIEVETRQAFMAADSAFARIGTAETAIDQAREALGIVVSRYRTGLLTIVELLDAETALHQARTDRVQAVHDFIVARAGLLLAAGLLGKDFQ
jgi:TolC family type I secretion outer membrane protein